jgi:hypothetical protein
MRDGNIPVTSDGQQRIEREKHGDAEERDGKELEVSQFAAARGI